MTLNLFGRSYRLLVSDPAGAASSGLDLSNLDIQFEVKRTLLPRKPNVANIKVWGLSDNSRKILSAPSGALNVSLSVGYGDTIHEIYKGEARSAYHVFDGPEVISNIETGDSEKAMQTARIRTTFPPGTTPGQVLKAISESLIAKGVGEGNLKDAIIHIESQGRVNDDGAAYYGNASDNLEDFCDSVGLDVSFQGRAFQFREKGKPILGSKGLISFSISPNSGLLGSPAVDYKNKEMVVTCKTLILPGLVPGFAVRLDSREAKGTFLIRDVQWKGESKGNDWHCELVMRELK